MLLPIYSLFGILALYQSAFGLSNIKRQSKPGNFTLQLWDENKATGKWLSLTGKLVDNEDDANIWSIDSRKRLVAGQDEDEGDLTYLYATMISESVLNTGTFRYIITIGGGSLIYDGFEIRDWFLYWNNTRWDSNKASPMKYTETVWCVETAKKDGEEGLDDVQKGDQYLVATKPSAEICNGEYQLEVVPIDIVPVDNTSGDDDNNGGGDNSGGEDNGGDENGGDGN